MVQMRGPFTVNGRRVWLSTLQRDLLMKMRPDGAAARDENGRLILECADGSSKPCGFNPQRVRRELIGLEDHGLLVCAPDKQWSLTEYGRKIRAELTRIAAA